MIARLHPVVVFVAVMSLAALVSGSAFRGWQHASRAMAHAVEESYRQ